MPGFQLSKVLFNSGFEIKTQIPFDQSAHGKEHLVPCYSSILSGLGTRFLSFHGSGLRNSSQESEKWGGQGQCEAELCPSHSEVLWAASLLW